MVLFCHEGEAPAEFTGSGGLYGYIQDNEVGLFGNGCDVLHGGGDVLRVSRVSDQTVRSVQPCLPPVKR